MGDLPFDSVRDEYAALRATIRERGSLRVVLFVLTLAVWGALALATAAVLAIPVSSLVPLLVLAGGFEAIASLHLGVERIGRYVQVRFEGDLPGDAPPLTTWERTSMAWGLRRFPGTGTDPLFATFFYLAAALNFVPVALTGIPAEIAVIAVAHVAFAWRVRSIKTWAARQRAEDLGRFQELLRAHPPQ